MRVRMRAKKYGGPFSVLRSFRPSKKKPSIESIRSKDAKGKAHAVAAQDEENLGGGTPDGGGKAGKAEANEEEGGRSQWKRKKNGVGV